AVIALAPLAMVGTGMKVQLPVPIFAQGVDPGIVVPSCPMLFAPQQYTWPVSVSAHAKALPSASTFGAVAPPGSVICRGVQSVWFKQSSPQPPSGVGPASNVS